MTLPINHLNFFRTSQEIGWENRPWNDLFSVKWDVKP